MGAENAPSNICVWRRSMYIHENWPIIASPEAIWGLGGSMNYNSKRGSLCVANMIVAARP